MKALLKKPQSKSQRNGNRSAMSVVPSRLKEISLPAKVPVREPAENRAPEWVQGTFVWRVVLPDGENCIARTAESIVGVQNLLDRTVRSCVITNGLIGVDESFQNWDGPWPYINRATYRAGHSWENIAGFMREMRDEHGAWISFHTNITDVNVGLGTSPELQQFFERLRAAEAIYTRDGEGCGVPLKGPAYVPQRIPCDVAKMPYVKAGDPADIFAIVNYKKFWDSGIAREMFDDFFARLPYPPLMLYIDVLTTTGSNLTAGLPDGFLGGSEATQQEGRRLILEYIRSKGTEPGGESPSWWTNYNWNHGGMSANDYSRIETGYSQGCMAWRGAEWQHVYGNMGAYSLDVSGKYTSLDVRYQAVEGGGTLMTGVSESAPTAEFSETAEWRTLPQVVEGFYLTAIQELYHIGLGNIRLPGGSGLERLDAHRGRLRLDRIDVYTAGRQWLDGAQASDGELTEPCALEPDPHSTNGIVVCKFEESLAGSCSVTLQVPSEAAGDCVLLVRYVSPLGGTAEVEVNGVWMGDYSFPATVKATIFGDLAIPITLDAGSNTLILRKGAIHAKWSDGTEARWDHQGFYAWNGEVTFGEGYDRMWPDTWSGNKKIYFYSRDGSQRAWKLPADWAGLDEASLFPLTAEGRGNRIPVLVQDRSVTARLMPRVPYILEPA